MFYNFLTNRKEKTCRDPLFIKEFDKKDLSYGDSMLDHFRDLLISLNDNPDVDSFDVDIKIDDPNKPPTTHLTLHSIQLNRHQFVCRPNCDENLSRNYTCIYPVDSLRAVIHAILGVMKNPVFIFLVNKDLLRSKAVFHQIRIVNANNINRLELSPLEHNLIYYSPYYNYTVNVQALFPSIDFNLYTLEWVLNNIRVLKELDNTVFLKMFKHTPLYKVLFKFFDDVFDDSDRLFLKITENDDNDDADGEYDYTTGW